MSQTKPDNGFPDDSTRIEAALQRIREGDRDEAARFLQQYESRIQRRIRGKLRSTPAMRRICDSLDIMSTIGRRLDVYVRNGNLTAKSEGEFIKLILVIADNAFIDKTRMFRRLREAENADGAFARQLLERLEVTETATGEDFSEEIAMIFELVPNLTDRTILHSWLNDDTWEDTAHQLDMSALAVRKRWQRIRDYLRERMTPISVR